MLRRCTVPGCTNTPGRTALRFWLLARRQNLLIETVGMCESHIRDLLTRKKISMIRDEGLLGIKEYEVKTAPRLIPTEIGSRQVAKILNCRQSEVNRLIKQDILKGKHLYGQKDKYLVESASLIKLIRLLEEGDLYSPQIKTIPENLLNYFLNNIYEIKERLLSAEF